MKLLFGGTKESTEVAKLLLDMNIDVTLSVVSDYGKLLASQYGQPVIQGRMSQDDMVNFILENNIDEVLDASHPFADIVSSEAILAAQRAGVPYVRFERTATADLTGAIVVHSTQEAIDKIKTLDGHVVYLGTGSKTLPLFTKGLPEKRIIARVLPTSEVIQICEDAGLVPDQIHALQAPFSKACNMELMKKVNTDIFVTKEGGTISGIREKIDCCNELGITCIVISRPPVNYPIMFSTLEELKKYLLVNKGE